MAGTGRLPSSGSGKKSGRRRPTSGFSGQSSFLPWGRGRQSQLVSDTAYRNFVKSSSSENISQMTAEQTTKLLQHSFRSSDDVRYPTADQIQAVPSEHLKTMSDSDIGKIPAANIKKISQEQLSVLLSRPNLSEQVIKNINPEMLTSEQLFELPRLGMFTTMYYPLTKEQLSQLEREQLRASYNDNNQQIGGIRIQYCDAEQIKSIPNLNGLDDNQFKALLLERDVKESISPAQISTLGSNKVQQFLRKGLGIRLNTVQISQEQFQAVNPEYLTADNIFRAVKNGASLLSPEQIAKLKGEQIRAKYDRDGQQTTGLKIKTCTAGQLNMIPDLEHLTSQQYVDMNDMKDMNDIENMSIYSFFLWALDRLIESPQPSIDKISDLMNSFCNQEMDQEVSDKFLGKILDSKLLDMGVVLKKICQSSHVLEQIKNNSQFKKSFNRKFPSIPCELWADLYQNGGVEMFEKKSDCNSVDTSRLAHVLDSNLLKLLKSDVFSAEEANNIIEQGIGFIKQSLELVEEVSSNNLSKEDWMKAVCTKQKSSSSRLDLLAETRQREICDVWIGKIQSSEEGINASYEKFKQSCLNLSTDRNNPKLSKFLDMFLRG